MHHRLLHAAERQSLAWIQISTQAATDHVCEGFKLHDPVFRVIAFVSSPAQLPKACFALEPRRLFILGAYSRLCHTLVIWIEISKIRRGRSQIVPLLAQIPDPLHNLHAALPCWALARLASLANRSLPGIRSRAQNAGSDIKWHDGHRTSCVARAQNGDEAGWAGLERRHGMWREVSQF